ncbi:cupin domain-containing protein [Candidatus Puniceispirillum sp.]|nr:cupin domain-containing protein [Candidatus Puniceispirillum sp.]
MTHPVSRNTQKAYKWSDGGVGWPLVEAGGFLVIEETLAPGCGEKHHYHNQAEQCFYMLAGCAVMQLADGQHVEIDTGMAINITPKTIHAIVNQTDKEIRFLVMSAPSSRGDRHEVEQEK